LPAMNAASAANESAMNERGLSPSGPLPTSNATPAGGGQPFLPGPVRQPVTEIKEWITYNSPRDGYSVLLPMKPDERNETISGATSSVVMCDLGLSAYAVTVRRAPQDISSLPGFSIAETMDALIDADVQIGGGQVLSRKRILFHGHPGLELSYNGNKDGRQFKAFSRYYAIDKTIYSLMYLGTEDPRSDDLQKFYESFKIVDESAAAAGASSVPSSPPGVGGAPGGPGYNGGPPGSSPPSGIGGPGGAGPGPGPGGPGASGPGPGGPGGFRSTPPSSSPSPNIGSPGGPSAPGGPSFRSGGPRG
jgi:hypothetical protein